MAVSRTVRRWVVFMSLIALPVAVIASPASGDLIIDRWELYSLVRDSISGQQRDLSIWQVQNPLQTSHSVTLGASTAATSYDISWSGDSATFLIRPDHRIEVLTNEQPRVLSGGDFNFTPSVDSILSVDMSYTYWMGAPYMASILSFTGPTFGRSEVASSLFEPVGTLRIQAEAPLPANQRTGVAYKAEMFSAAIRRTGLIGQAAGEIRFTITPVPAPASGLLLLLAAAALRRRRRRGTRTLWAGP